MATRGSQVQPRVRLRSREPDTCACGGEWHEDGVVLGVGLGPLLCLSWHSAQL